MDSEMYQQEESQYLTLKVNQDYFAINILVVKEIIEYGKITRVPMTPHFIKGVYNLRGHVVPVISLASRFALPIQKITKLTCIVIVEQEVEKEKHSIGVIVDEVDEVLNIPPEQIEPPPTFGAKIRPEYIRGMGKVNKRFIILLNVPKVLDIIDLSNFKKHLTLGHEGDRAE